MKKYVPGIIFGFLALTVVAALFIYLDRQPQKAVGRNDGDEEMLSLKLSDDGSYYTVTGPGNFSGTDIVIPSEYKEIPIKEIGKWAFREKRNITSVTIPDTVEKICESAFKGTSITEVTVPDSVKIMEGYVFSGCEKLERTSMPKSINELGGHIFEGCQELKEVNLPENLTEIPEYMFFNCINLENIRLPDVTEKIGDYAFDECNSLKHIDLPESLIIISNDAFRGSGLTEAALPDGLKEIGNSAFMGCPIDEIVFPDGLEKIGNMAFKHTCLKSVFIPGSVLEIGCSPFGGVYSIFGERFTENVTVSDENPVYYSENNCIITRESGELIFTYDPDSVPKDGSVKIIGSFAYSDINADTVSIPEGVTLLKQSAIANFNRIDEIILPKSLEKMERSAISAVNYHSESVKRITFSGTHEQWMAMERDEEWLSSKDKVLIIDLVG